MLSVPRPMPAAVDIAEYLARHEQKELLRFVAVGSVDDGKSTLIGRLLHDTHGLYEDQLAALEALSRRRGAKDGALDLSLVTDGLKAEREQGITIDVAYRYFSTDKRKFIIADTPGHVQYTRNMATGASTADLAVILIDARHGVLQQSRRHALVAALLGIGRLAVCVNKMDLCGFDEGVFRAIERDFSAYAANLPFHELRTFPISAIAGDNVVRPSERCPWHRAGTLLSYLESVSLDSGGVAAAPLRFPVQYVLRAPGGHRGLAGQIASGAIAAGDEVAILPGGKRAKVAAVDGAPDRGIAPMSVSVRLAEQIDVSRGDMLVHPGGEPTLSRRFEAMLVWLGEQPLDHGKSYLLKHTTRLVRASVESIAGRIDLESLAQVEARGLSLNDIAKVAIACNQPLFVDPYSDNRRTGAFILIDALHNETVAAGMIARALDDAGQGPARRERGLVPRPSREQRVGHRALLAWFAGDPEQGQAELAFDVERLLFAAGCLATVVDVEQLYDPTRSPMLFADIAEQCLRTGAIVLFAGALRRPADREQIRARVPEDQRIELRMAAAADLCDELRRRLRIA